MKSPAFKKIEVFNDKYPLIGPAFWIVSVQYFITQLVVGLHFMNSYSLAKNTISDLGNSACGLYSGRFVCSPLHDLMNVSFIVLGATMIAGSSLIYHEFKKDLGAKFGFSFMALAGFGTIIVGLFPENTIPGLHFFGASLPFLVGNTGITLLGIYLDIPKTFRVYTIFSGVLMLTALVLFVTKNYVGLGQGGMERLTSYPQTAWLIIFGIYMSRNHFKAIPKK